MQRVANTPRPDWRTGLRQNPYGAVAIDAAVCWDESVRYEFSADQIDIIEGVADEIHALVHDAVHHVVDNRLYGLLGMSPEVGRLIDDSWQPYYGKGRRDQRRGGLFGRLDFAYDGSDDLRLIGCNYDNPTGLFEASIVQWNWLEARSGDADQFNSLHEALTDRWREMVVGIRGRDRLHLTCATPDPRLEGEAAYLAATADEAGIDTRFISIQDIGWDGKGFTDLDEDAISWLLKLYPWEALTADEFGLNLRTAPISVLNPAWQIPASNHGVLAALWGLFPEHPNLCRASLTEAEVTGAGAVIHRSLLGLDHPAERITRDNTTIAETEAIAESGGTVHIARPDFVVDGERKTVLQAWMVGDKCRGMTVREQTDDIYSPDTAAIMPHLFR